MSVSMQEEKQEKSSLQHLDSRPPRCPHPVWKHVPNNPIEVRKAEVKAKLLTRSYTLQSDRSKFTKEREDSTCRICHTEDEDTKHFLLECSALTTVRQKFLDTIEHYINNQEQYNCYDMLSKEGLLMKLILEPSSKTLSPYMRKMKSANHKELESITRNLCYSLHIRRSAILSKKH